MNFKIRQTQGTKAILFAIIPTNIIANQGLQSFITCIRWFLLDDGQAVDVGSNGDRLDWNAFVIVQYIEILTLLKV